MKRGFPAVVTKEDTWLIARCMELDVVSQGKTIPDAPADLKEAVHLYLESFSEEEVPENAGEMPLYPLEVGV